MGIPTRASPAARDTPDDPDAPIAGTHIRRFPVRTPTLPPATHTNVYAVGEGEISIVDPASPWGEEQAALDRWLDERAEDGERVVEIALTHHHLDHVSGANHLAARLGVPIAAHPLTARLLDGRIKVDRAIEEGGALACRGATVRALHTPGHAPGHLVFVEEDAGAVIAGDMVASVGTIIIDPPEGDMRIYLESLARLQRLDARVLLPAHGPPIEDPQRLLGFYIAHRLEREARVAAALLDHPGLTPLDLVPHAYPEVQPAIWPLAARSLLAHLIKLQADGRAVTTDGRWRAH